MVEGEVRIDRETVTNCVTKCDDMISDTADKKGTKFELFLSNALPSRQRVLTV